MASLCGKFASVAGQVARALLLVGLLLPRPAAAAGSSETCRRRAAEAREALSGGALTRADRIRIRELYTLAVAHCPDHAPYRHNLARAYELLGVLDEAVQQCRRYVLQLDPAARGEAGELCRTLTHRLDHETSTLIVETRPVGALVVLDGDELHARSGPATWRLLPGAYRFTVSADGYHDEDFEHRVTGPGEVSRLPITLRCHEGHVSVDSTPPGAAVSVNGDPGGTTPLERHALCPGTYEVRLALARHRDAVVQLPVAAGGESRHTLTLEPLPGVLSIDTAPSPAQVRVEGEGTMETCTSPCPDLSLPAGTYTVTVSHPDYPDDETRIDVGPEERIPLHVVLRKPWWSLRRIVGVTSLSLAAVSLGTAIGLHATAQPEYDDAVRCLDGGMPAEWSACARRGNDARQRLVASYWLYGVSAALVTTGLVLLLLPEEVGAGGDVEDADAGVPRVEIGIGWVGFELRF